MQDLVYRLVERLASDEPLSRNRHYHTFTHPEGKRALRIARHLRSVARDISAASEPPSLTRLPDDGVRIEVPLPLGVRTTWLNATEWRILQQMSGVRHSLGGEV